MALDAMLLKTQIKYGSPNSLVSELVLERLPEVFSGNWTLFRAWRASLAPKLNVDPCDIVITGSAAVGISLNPANEFSVFDDGSDIDLAIISPYHFDTAWRVLREAKSSQVSALEWGYIQEHKQYYIFEGCIALDRILHLMPFGVTWKSGLAKMQNESPTEGRDIKARVYRDNDSLRLYQMIGIEKLKISLNKGEM